MKRLANKSLVNFLYDIIPHYSERGKKTRQTEEEVGRQHQEMDRPGLRQGPEGNGEERKMEESGCEASVVPQRPSRLMDTLR